MAFLPSPVEIIIEGDSFLYYGALISVVVGALVDFFFFNTLHAFISKDLSILIRTVEIIVYFEFLFCDYLAVSQRGGSCTGFFNLE